MGLLYQQNKKTTISNNENVDPVNKQVPVSVRCPDVPYGSSIVDESTGQLIVNKQDCDTTLFDYTKSLDLDTMQKELAPFIVTAHQLTDVNEFTAPKILSSLSRGLAQVLHYQSVVKVKANLAAANRKNTEARVAINEFTNWAKETSNKQTDETRKLFISQHSLVMSAKKEEYELEALYDFLSGIRQLFVMSLSSAKSIAYGNRDSYNVSGIRNE